MFKSACLKGVRSWAQPLSTTKIMNLVEEKPRLPFLCVKLQREKAQWETEDLEGQKEEEAGCRL